MALYNQTTGRMMGRKTARKTKPVQITEEQRRKNGIDAGWGNKHGSPEWAYNRVELLKFHWARATSSIDEMIELIEEVVEASAWDLIPTNKPYGNVHAMFETELGVSYDTVLDMTLEKVDPYPDGIAKAAESMTTDDIADLITQLQSIVKDRGSC